MLQFPHTGRDPRDENRFRKVFMGALLAVTAILLFPFTLLVLFLWGLSRLGAPAPEPR